MNIKILSVMTLFLISSFGFSQCENDYTNYGSANCDTAWEEYGLNCQALQSNYGWDCSGCACPGDDNGGGSDGGCWQTNPLTGDLEWYDDCGGGWEFDIPGCTDPDATNYNEFANIDDGTCYYGWSDEACLATECGQMLQAGLTCDEILEYGYVNCDECEACSTSNDIPGCMDPEANNYNPEATVDNGTCEYSGCPDGQVQDCADADCCQEAWIGDGVCDGEDQVYGCDLTCYDNDAGDCEEEDVYGCTDETADNYNPEATLDDGSCLYNGCPVGEVQDCNQSGICIDSFFIGDGWCQDGSDSQYNFDLTCYDNDGGDCEHQEELDLTLTLLSPQAGDHISDYSAVDISWSYEGSDTTDIYLSFNCSYYVGGGLIEVRDGVPLDEGHAVVDLQYDLNGEWIDAETIFANFKIIASNLEGLTSQVECSDYFIIGDPEGEMNATYISEEESSFLLDWAWMEDQTIVIDREAIVNLSDQGFEFIKIFDLNGIHTNTCEDTETGPIILDMIDIRQAVGDEFETKILTLPCGFDYCFEDGDRITGYLPQNQIRFSTGYFEQSEYEMMPQSAQLIDGPMLFDNGTYVIDSFTVGLLLDEQNTSIIDEREWDEFNIYGKITNHQGSSTRECNNDGVCQPEEAIATCFDDCCNDPGTGDNDEWCYLETVIGISNFEDNMTNGNYVSYVPAGTSSATFNYRVWLLDNDGEEVVKTIDTEIDYEADNLFCEGDGDVSGDNQVDVIDIVALVAEILNPGTITDPVLLCEADINADTLINVIDVVALVAIILGN